MIRGVGLEPAETAYVGDAEPASTEDAPVGEGLVLALEGRQADDGAAGFATGPPGSCRREVASACRGGRRCAGDRYRCGGHQSHGTRVGEERDGFGSGVDGRDVL